MCSKRESGLWFYFEILEDGRFRFFYAHENNTLMDWSKLVCTHEEMAKMKVFLNKTDVIESCSRERINTNWRFYKLTNLTLFAALVEDIPMGCKNAVSPKPLHKNHTINCLTFEENTRQLYKDNFRLFRYLALHLHGNERLEKETSNFFSLFINKMNGLSAGQFRVVYLNNILFVEDLQALSILLYDIDIVDGNIFEEVARRSIQK